MTEDGCHVGRLRRLQPPQTNAVFRLALPFLLLLIFRQHKETTDWTFAVYSGGCKQRNRPT